MLITGVTGMVGRALARRLDAAGRAIVGLSRSPERARDAMPAGATAHAWSGADGPIPAGALEGARAIVHLAGEPVSGRWTKAKRARIKRSRIEGTRRVIEALAATEERPEVLVCASAMGFYGDRGDAWLDEDEPAGDDFLAEVCVGWEREAQQAEALGVRVVRLRISLVLGADGVLGAMKPLFLAGLGGPIGDGRQQWSWVHQDDLVSLIEKALEDRAVEGPLNAAAGAVSQREFADALGGALGRPAFVPTPKLFVRAAMSGFADELVNSRRLDSARARSLGWKPRFGDLGEALRDALDVRG